MSYSIKRQQDDKYGKLIVIDKTDAGESDPFFIVQKGIREYNTWNAEEISRIRFLIDGQIYDPPQLNAWAREETQHIVRCGYCGIELKDTVVSHKLGRHHLFCSQHCADQDYSQEVDHQNECHDTDYCL